VTSSDGSLPDPETCGSNSLEDVIADLKYTGNFTPQDISHEDMSQIIRAGYGCTPHTTCNGRGGLTVPSWCAEYYLTGNIYVVDQDGVFRYHNRNPGSDLTKRDHRLERIQVGDVKDGLRSGICLMRRVMLCCAWTMRMWISGMRTLRLDLLQGSALGVGCWFSTELSGKERTWIREMIESEADDVSVVVVSVGMFEP
jgi:hypothetical protein